MAEFMKTVFKAVRRIAIIALAVSVLYQFCSTTMAADFDPLWYAEQNPDVVAELGDSPEMLELHYEIFGKTECRMANSVDVEAKLRKLFNAEEYAVLYPDVVEAFGDDPDILFRHYVAYGILESRKASEKMSTMTVANLKAALTDALESIGAEAVPGSVAIITVMEGSITDNPEVQNAFVQVQDALVEAVETTIVEANKPVDVSSDDDDDEEEEGCGPYVDPCNGNHKWVYEDTGWHRCSVCHIVKASHIWTKNSDTHTCNDCGHVESHDPDIVDNTKCVVCGATISSGNTGEITPGGNDNSDNSGDDDNS